jgi:hypothetical protein
VGGRRVRGERGRGKGNFEFERGLVLAYISATVMVKSSLKPETREGKEEHYNLFQVSQKRTVLEMFDLGPREPSDVQKKQRS